MVGSRISRTSQRLIARRRRSRTAPGSVRTNTGSSMRRRGAVRARQAVLPKQAETSRHLSGSRDGAVVSAVLAAGPVGRISGRVLGSALPFLYYNPSPTLPRRLHGCSLAAGTPLSRVVNRRRRRPLAALDRVRSRCALLTMQSTVASTVVLRPSACAWFDIRPGLLALGHRGTVQLDRSGCVHDQGHDLAPAVSARLRSLPRTLCVGSPRIPLVLVPNSARREC